VRSKKNRWELAALLLILGVALFFRTYRLSGPHSAPPGMTHDEADTGYFVAAVYRGEPAKLEMPYSYANEPFSMYSGALFMALFGPTELVLRLHAAFFNLLMLLFLYLWARMAFGRAVALGAAALLAVSFWPVSTARFALNWQPAAALFTGAVWFLWRGWFGKGFSIFSPRSPCLRGKKVKGGRWTWLLFALCLTGSIYSYEVARATAAAVIAFGLYLALFHRERFRGGGRWFLAAMVLFGALAAPHLLEPGAWGRASTLATTWRALLAGDPKPMLATTLEALGAFTVEGDPFITYNIPGRPVFDPWMGALFYGGVALCLWRWRRPECALVLLWLAFGLAPVAVVGVWNFTSHGMGMQAVVFLPPALAAVEIGRWVKRRWGPTHPGRAQAAVGIVFAALVCLVALTTFRDYFSGWSQWPQVEDAYFHDLANATAYLNDAVPAGIITLSSPFPNFPHDPFIADLRVQRDDVSIRWSDGRGGLVFPNVTSAHLVALADAPLAASLDLPSLKLLEQGDGFDVYRWNPAADRQALLDSWSAQSNEVAVNFGDAIELVGYNLPRSAAPGELAPVTTMWRILGPAGLGTVPANAYGRSAAIFIHLLDPAGEIVAQQDRLDSPAWNWQAGDSFAQLHQITLPAGLPPGEYSLMVGVYTRPDLVRLPIVGGGGRWELGALEVVSP